MHLPECFTGSVIDIGPQEARTMMTDRDSWGGHLRDGLQLAFA